MVPEATRGVFFIGQPALFPPSEVVLDTSFVVEALLPAQPHHEACQRFLERLAEAEAVVYFNLLLEMELFEAAFQIALKERHPSDWKRFRDDGRARARASRLLSQVRAAWREVLDALTWSAVELGEVADRVPDLMVRHGLASYDAVHAATALHVGVKDLVTQDVGFCSVPASLLHLHVGDTARVRRCRELRRASAGRGRSAGAGPPETSRVT